jgi:hypothetical protein
MKMKFAKCVCVCVGLAASLHVEAGGSVAVRSYIKSNGTVVQPHMRSGPDGSFSNNWTTSGNVNPYTGEAGKKTQPGYSYGTYGGAWGVGYQPQQTQPMASPQDGAAQDASEQIKDDSPVKEARLSSEEKSSMELACISTRINNPGGYQNCLNKQAAATMNSDRPNISSLSYTEKSSIELACISAKMNGPASMNSCIQKQINELESTRPVSTSGLSYDEKSALELACISAKMNGPASLYRCMERQIDALRNSPSPSMSNLNFSEKQSLDLACISAKMQGPASMNSCRTRQLASMGK